MSEELLREPSFATRGDWSIGYDLAVGHGPGVVVGPGRDNPNVFGQPFSVGFGTQYAVTATAASVDGEAAIASVQINWMDAGGGFINSTMQLFTVGPEPVTVDLHVVPPWNAASGNVYVVPGKFEPVRYTEMGVVALNPFTDPGQYLYFGLRAPEAGLVAGVAVLVAVALFVARRPLARFAAAAEKPLSHAIGWLAPPVAILLVGWMITLVIPMYEHHYDSQAHQGWVEIVETWKTPGPDLGGNPIRSFGIQPLTNPSLSPAYLLGSFAPPDHRMAVEALIQATIMLLISLALLRKAGAGRVEACGIALVAFAYCWNPVLSNVALTLNGMLGLFWQETAMATLLAFFCFACIGLNRPRTVPWAAIAFGAVVLWYLVSLPYQTPYFVLAVTPFCLAALLCVQSRRELIHKVGTAIAVAALLLALRADQYVIYIFAYTPQVFFGSADPYDYAAMFRHTTSNLLSAAIAGNSLVYVFYGLAALGGLAGVLMRNRWALRIVVAAVMLEVWLFALGGLNAAFGLVPVNLLYIEQIAISVPALLAGVGVLTILRAAGWLAERLVLLIPRGRRPIAGPGPA